MADPVSLPPQGVNNIRPDCREHATDEAIIMEKSNDFLHDLTWGEMHFFQIDRVILRQNEKELHKTDASGKKVTDKTPARKEGMTSYLRP